MLYSPEFVLAIAYLGLQLSSHLVESLDFEFFDQKVVDKLLLILRLVGSNAGFLAFSELRNGQLVLGYFAVQAQYRILQSLNFLLHAAFHSLESLFHVLVQELFVGEVFSVRSDSAGVGRARQLLFR